MILRLELYFIIVFNLSFGVSKRWISPRFDKIFTYVYLVIVLSSSISACCRDSFWDEFGVRFNFIAVDYLIYTYEVISNINESYPLPLIILYWLR